MTRTTPRKPAPWWRRFLPIGLSLCLALPLSAQAPPDLPAATTTSGLSIHQDFYEDVNAAILADNDGRTAVYSGAAFTPYTDAIETEVEALEDLIELGFDGGMAILSALLPAIGLIILAILQALAGLICGGTDPTVKLDFPQAGVVAAFTVEDMQIAQRTTGERFTVTVSDVGLLAEIRTEVGIGSSCTDESKDDVRFVYPSLTYQVDVQFTPAGPVVVAQLVGGLPPIDKRFDGNSDFTADTLWGWANTTIGGADLEDKLEEFAVVQVPDHLELMYTNWFLPYLARSGWLVNLSGGKQTQRYADNQVAATVGPALYAPLVSDLPDSKVRVVFDNAHSAVPAHPLALCTDYDFVAGPVVAPNFDAEDPSAQGSFHTSYKRLEHSILAGIVGGVGLRHEDKAASPLIVEHPLLDLVPEAGANTINWLFRNVNSPITPIPLSASQMNGLVMTPAGGGELLRQVPLGELELKIRVCEASRPTRAFPLAGPDGTGVVQHEVVLRVTIERAGLDVLEETLFATFEGALRLSKVPKKDSIELRTQRAELVSLFNEQGVDLSQLSLSTPFDDAPVSLFLRAFLGDNTLPIPSGDTRPFYLYEGLTGPLVERAAHGMVVLPGLDFPAFDGAEFGDLASAEPFHADDYEIGLDFDHHAMCATILRWGETLAMVGGSPSGTDFMLEIEVAWSALPAVQPSFNTTTGVSATVVPSPVVPLVTENPSRHDAGFLATDYQPANGDETRVMNASGYRMGDFLPGGGQHYVAATALGYRNLRESMPASLYPDTTIELRPYRRAILPPCATLFPGPIHAPPHVGAHHVDGPLPDVYEALTFETRKDCKGIGNCDGARVVAMWTAPLFHDCPGPAPLGPFGVDYRTFNTTEGTICVPPSEYVFAVEVCQSNPGPIFGEPVGKD